MPLGDFNHNALHRLSLDFHFLKIKKILKGNSIRRCKENIGTKEAEIEEIY